MDAVLQLVGDKNDNIRRSAIEILNQTKDERAVDYLIKATRDSDWWVRERAADALAEIRSEKAAPALLEMLAGDARSVPAALRALGQLGSTKVLPQLLPTARPREKDIRIEAVNAIGRLANSDSADTVKNRLKPLATGADETIAKVAAEAMARIESIAATSVTSPGANTRETAGDGGQDAAGGQRPRRGHGQVTGQGHRSSMSARSRPAT